ncbi:GGDEF domain-containing protein [Photobacterium sp. 1_MG-2023]|uniref:GGDEF domain-containing protein n=1 Tax=Photobacterium sp. 1_MG-2023 TaxID=3062646 RepID=UPI0026E35BCD|nr:GGDEF domain-containing protein [Photobacterium sp. 1_MG-2023]MDO6706539.1 GGDEF domain-containing protein [Photobacterium sp. 1_MG-2023]
MMIFKSLKVFNLAGMPWMKKLLFLAAPLLIVFTFVSVSALESNAESVSKNQNLASWFMMQLGDEYSQLIFQLHEYEAGRATKDDALLQYEILLSRFNSIKVNSQMNRLHDTLGSLQTFQHHFQLVKDYEHALQQLSFPGESIVLLNQIKTDYDDLMSYALKTFLFSNNALQSKYNHIISQRWLIHSLLFSTVLIGFIMIYLLKKESEAHHRLAMYDSLTGIHNRLWLNRKLKSMEKNQHVFAFYLIDLNGFKEINDTLGHGAGDQLLKTVARRLDNLTHEGMDVARMGGDEFAVIQAFPHAVNHEYVAHFLLNTLDHVMRIPIQLKDREVTVSASIGLSIYVPGSKSLSELLQEADFSMYEMKQQFKIQAPAPAASMYPPPPSQSMPGYFKRQ